MVVVPDLHRDVYAAKLTIAKLFFLLFSVLSAPAEIKQAHMGET